MARSANAELIARRAAAELRPGQVVALGHGLPGLVPGYTPTERGVVFLAEAGTIGYSAVTGRPPPDVVGTGGGPVGLLAGTAIASPADTFGAVRGGHVDVALVEASQVSGAGDLAGCSLDFAVGAGALIALVEHTGTGGEPGIVGSCTLPVDPRRHADLVITDLAVFRVGPEGLVLVEIAPEVSDDDVRAATGAGFSVDPGLRQMDLAGTTGPPPGKVYATAAEAVADIHDGAVILIDGFAGPGGMAHTLLLALRDQGASDLTMVSNTAGIARVASFGTPPGYRAIDHSILVDSGQIRKAIASFPVSPSPSRPSSFELAYRRGEAELELSPQGTLAERIRAGGYGIVAFYTPTGAGTPIAEGKEPRVIDGKEYVLERGLRADFALLRARRADTLGNLVYKGTSRNFNAVMAPAARVTIVEADEIVEPGTLDPDAVVTPGIFVNRLVHRPPDFSPYEALA